jgi:uncharacterized protein (UPF0261 family)
MTTGPADTATDARDTFPKLLAERARTSPDRPAYREKEYATGPVAVMVPTRGLSIPSVPGGAFWNPESDAGFLETLRADLRGDIPVSTHDVHINDSEFAHAVADRFVALLDNQGQNR